MSLLDFDEEHWKEFLSVQLLALSLEKMSDLLSGRPLVRHLENLYSTKQFVNICSDSITTLEREKFVQ